MSSWLIAFLIALALVVVQYGSRRISIGIALLRLVALTLVAALLLDAPIGRAKAVAPWVALDGSVSWMRAAGDSAMWRSATNLIRSSHADSIIIFGDSARVRRAATTPSDQASIVGPAVERSLASGRPLIVLTDGDVDDPESLKQLPAGSRVEVVARPPRRDVAVLSLEMSRAHVSGDTLEVRASLSAGDAGAAAGTLTLYVGQRAVTSAPIDAMGAFAERTVVLRGMVEGPEGPALVRVVATSPGDAEVHNDTVSAVIDVSRAASAVFVSTSPDPDARYALTVLRGALSIPTRGYLRVAPGMWRAEGALTAVSESDVRNAFRDAPLAILHGDTAVFGTPRTVAQGPLALLVPSTLDDGEWYATQAPASPLAAALSGLPWDSLPPIVTAPSLPAGEWRGLEARRGREDERRAVIVGSERPRRTVIVGGSGFWRWRFRGGVASDAYGALWGSIFDWLSAQRADRRAAVPDDKVFRAGEPIRWRRGSQTDSQVVLTLTRRGAPARVDTVSLTFAGASTIQESPPLPAGVYDVSTRGGKSLLTVNASREWLPRAARAKSGAAGGTVLSDSAPRLRDHGWAFAAALAMLCLEWVLRRRQGLR
jgi:hypothetical protein